MNCFQRVTIVFASSATPSKPSTPAYLKFRWLHQDKHDQTQGIETRTPSHQYRNRQTPYLETIHNLDPTILQVRPTGVVPPLVSCKKNVEQTHAANTTAQYRALCIASSLVDDTSQQHPCYRKISRKIAAPSPLNLCILGKLMGEEDVATCKLHVLPEDGRVHTTTTDVSRGLAVVKRRGINCHQMSGHRSMMSWGVSQASTGKW